MSHCIEDDVVLENGKESYSFIQAIFLENLTTSYICVCVRAGGGWGRPCGKTGKPTSAVGLQLSAFVLILDRFIILFMS